MFFSDSFVTCWEEAAARESVPSSRAVDMIACPDILGKTEREVVLIYQEIMVRVYNGSSSSDVADITPNKRSTADPKVKEGETNKTVTDDEKQTTNNWMDARDTEVNDNIEKVNEQILESWANPPLG